MEMEFEDGVGTLKIDAGHPLMAAFRRTLQTGSPAGKWMLLIVRPSSNEAPRLLGSIAWTRGGRFLFFPGRIGECQSNHPDKRLNGRVLDHVTLELDSQMRRYSEHTAVMKEDGAPGARGQARRGAVLKDHLHPWFSLLISDIGRYELLPRVFTCKTEVPASDIVRRTHAMLSDGKRTVCSFPTPGQGGLHYYQLDVWAGVGEDWSKRQAAAIPWPTCDGVVQGHMGEAVTTYKQVHVVDLQCGVVTVLSRPTGTLPRPGLVHASIGPPEPPVNPAE